MNKTLKNGIKDLLKKKEFSMDYLLIKGIGFLGLKVLFGESL